MLALHDDVELVISRVLNNLEVIFLHILQSYYVYIPVVERGITMLIRS